MDGLDVPGRLSPDGIVQFGDDSRVFVTFYKRSVHNAHKSSVAGIPIHDSVDYMKLIFPGEKETVIDQPVKEWDKHRFKRQWEAFTANKSQHAGGTPLDALFPDNPEIVATLKAMHVHSVQALAAMGDNAAMNMHFGGDLRQKAQQYLAVAEKGKGYHALQQKQQEQEDMIRRLNEQIEQLRAEKSPKKGVAA